MKRQLIEEDNNYVQIISLFHVISTKEVSNIQANDRLPELRLHYTKSVNFGGHLQDIDRAPSSKRCYKTISTWYLCASFMKSLFLKMDLNEFDT